MQLALERGPRQAASDWKSFFLTYWGLLFFVFLLLVLFVARFAGLSTPINRLVAPVLALAFIVHYRRMLSFLPAEAFLLGWLGLWLVSGSLVAIDERQFWVIFKLVVQVFILSAVVMLVIGGARMVLYAWLAFIASAMGAIVQAVFTGEAFRVADPSQATQLSGILRNANGFGYLMLLAVFGTIFLWHRARSNWERSLLGALLFFAGIGIVLSASRKAFVTLLFFLLVWSLLCYGKFINKRPAYFLGICLLVLVLFAATRVTLDNSYLGSRLQETRNVEELQRKETGRLTMYEETFRLTLSHPLFGVGLGNFRFYSVTNSYTHSDFAEILVTGGIPAFLLYGIGLAITGSRLIKLRRRMYGRPEFLEVGVLLAAYWSHLAIGLGRPHFLDLYSMTFYGILVGQGVYMERKLLQEKNLHPSGRLLPRHAVGRMPLA